MSVPQVVLVTLVAWRLGPQLLRRAGQLLAIIAIAVTCVARAHAQPSTIALLITAAIGACACQAGTAWQRQRRHHQHRHRRELVHGGHALPDGTGMSTNDGATPRI